MNQRPSSHHILFLLILTFASALPARTWYDPGQGRWCSRDPIGKNGGENLYGFASNSPCGETDLLGPLPSPLDGAGAKAVAEALTQANFFSPGLRTAHEPLMRTNPKKQFLSKPTTHG